MTMPLPASFQSLELTLIDHRDDLFALSPPGRRHPEVIDSVARVGYWNPIHVETAEEHFRIVDGFARVEAAVALGHSELPALVLAPRDAATRFRERLEARLTTRPLDLLERALALRKMKSRLGIPEDELIQQVLPLMGLRPERFQLQRHLELASVAPHLLGALPGLQAEIAVKLNAWSEPEQYWFLHLLDRYRLGINYQKEAFQWMDELRQSRAKTAVEIWEESGAGTLDAQESIPAPQRWVRIRQLLNRIRHPKLAEMEQRDQKLKHELQLPSQLDLRWPAFFEGDQIRFELTAHSLEELRRLARKLQEIAAAPQMRTLFELL